MNNPKLCKNCETLNTLDSKFCNQCGKRLPGVAIDLASDAEIRKEIDSLVEAKMEQLTEFAASLEDKIELDCIKEIDAWIRKGGFLGAFLALFALLGGGVTAWSLKDVEQQTSKAKEQISEKYTNFENNVKQKTAEISNKVTDASNLKEEINTVKNEIDHIKINISQKYSKIDGLVKEAKQRDEQAKNAVEDIRSLRDKTTSYVNKAKESIKHTENATYDIFVELAGKSDSEGFLLAKDKLLENGFRISDSNVLQFVEVDHNEIVYFSELNKPKAEEIKVILNKDYEDIKLQYINNSDKGARDLKLKLRDHT